MAHYFLDSSAVIKLYQTEEGSAAVERIVSEADATRFIARLTLVEVQRALCEHRKFRHKNLMSCAEGSMRTCCGDAFGLRS